MNITDWYNTSTFMPPPASNTAFSAAAASPLPPGFSAAAASPLPPGFFPEVVPGYPPGYPVYFPTQMDVPASARRWQYVLDGRYLSADTTRVLTATLLAINPEEGSVGLWRATMTWLDAGGVQLHVRTWAASGALASLDWSSNNVRAM